jgi:membrane protease YdiL (CAAX protease family)
MDTAGKNMADRNRLIVFVAVAYGLSFLMMIPMYIGKQKGLDLTQIVDAQMCSPAAGVALGYLLFFKGEKRVPKMFMWVLVINYAVQLLLGLLSIFANPFMPDDMITLQEGVELPVGTMYLLAGQSILIIGSILLWVGYFIAKKEGRRFAGISRNNEKTGILMILLFVGLYLVRVFAPAIIEGVRTDTLQDIGPELTEMIKSPVFLLGLVSLPFNYPLTIIAFFGEEYAWRGYLQPVMQRKFGMKAGVVLLGVVWSLWHITVDTMYYTDDSVPQMIVGQLITCVFMSIFWGFVYLKTNNIWIIVCMHFLNNNLLAVFSGQNGTDALTGQSVSWIQVVEILLVDVVLFGLFILAKEYKEKKKEETVNA